jgi:hypothetical protein
VLHLLSTSTFQSGDGSFAASAEKAATIQAQKWSYMKCGKAVNIIKLIATVNEVHPTAFSCVSVDVSSP